MNLSDLRSTLPDYAKDLKLNLDSVLSDSGSPGLDGKQIRAVALASAIAGICRMTKASRCGVELSRNRFTNRRPSCPTLMQH